MKKLFYFALAVFALFACEDEYETVHRFSHPYYLSKSYPVLLDASDIRVDVAVQPATAPNTAFKIVMNDRYIFVGEKMKGIHVHEKTGEYSTTPLCFIECKYIKAFEVVVNILYCNNFTDLLVVDVENPQLATVLHREKDYFNKYTNSMNNLPLYWIDDAQNPYMMIGQKDVILTGTETHDSPAPNFSKYDQLYGNMIVKEIPDTLQTDLPYAGFVNIDDNIFTFGHGNTLDLCSYTAGALKIQPAIITSEYPYFNPVGHLLYKDGVVFILKKDTYEAFGNNNGVFTLIPNYIGWNTPPFDAIPVNNLGTGDALLSKDFIRGRVIVDGWHYSYEIPSLRAISVTNVNDTILALGNQLTQYRFVLQHSDYYYFVIQKVKQYADISGLCMVKSGNVLIVAGKEGILFYDISDLEDIKPYSA